LDCLNPENRGIKLDEISITSEGLNTEDGGKKTPPPS
jgi:hypothetical protein